jgi:hypothetical protein
MHKADATGVAVEDNVPFFTLPRVAEAATLGWRPMPRWGITEKLIVIVSDNPTFKAKPC